MGLGFPIVLRLNGTKCLVIGTSPEADSKARAMAESGASVDRLESYSPGSLGGYFLAIAAAPDRSQNAAIFEEATRSGVLLNAVDDPAHCHFTFPSVHRQGDLQIATSTNGACPALSARLRERFAAEFGPEYAEFLELARSLRIDLAERFPDFAKRRAAWYRLVDSEALDLLRHGDRDAAERLVKSILMQDAIP